MPRLFYIALTLLGMAGAVFAQSPPSETTAVVDAESGAVIDVLDFAAQPEAYEGRRLRFENVLMGSARISGVAWIQLYYERRPLDTVAIDLPDDASVDLKKWMFLTCPEWEATLECVGDVEGDVQWNSRLTDAEVEAFERASKEP